MSASRARLPATGRALVSSDAVLVARHAHVGVEEGVVVELQDVAGAALLPDPVCGRPPAAVPGSSGDSGDQRQVHRAADGHIRAASDPDLAPEVVECVAGLAGDLHPERRTDAQDHKPGAEVTDHADRLVRVGADVDRRTADGSRFMRCCLLGRCGRRPVGGRGWGCRCAPGERTGRLVGSGCRALQRCCWQHRQTWLRSGSSASTVRPESGIRRSRSALAAASHRQAAANNPGDVVTLAESALRAERELTPAVVGFLYGRLVVGAAHTGDTTASQHAQDRAFELLGQSVAENEPPWIYWFTEAEAQGAAGESLLALGRPGEAELHLRRAVGLLGSDFSRDRALWLCELASARLGRGSVEQACATATEAAVIIHRLNSPHGRRKLIDFRAAATPYARSAAVREFDAKHRDLVGASLA